MNLSLPTALLSVDAPGETDDATRDELLDYLDRLFAFAQVLTLNAEQAIQLTEATYRRALRTAATWPIEAAERRARLLRIMLQVYDERYLSPAFAEQNETTTSESTRTELADFRGRLAEQYVERLLPAVFATLPAGQRLLLMLCDVEGHACQAVDALLELDEGDACRGLKEAHQTVEALLYENATDIERHLLEMSLPEAWQPAALQRLAKSELIPLPPTLRPRVRSVIDQPIDEAEASAVEETPIAPPVTVVNSGDRGPARRTGGAKRMRRLLAVLTVIVLAGVLGYGGSRLQKKEPELNLITLSAHDAGAEDAIFRTSAADQAEHFIRDRLGWRVILPGIERASLTGVSIHEIAKDVMVPVFHFEDDASHEPITLFTYTYALLDRFPSRIALASDVLRQIAREGHFDLYDLGENKVLVWRSRDDIFVAVTPGDPEALRDRIYFPS